MKIHVSLKRKWGKHLFYPLSEDAGFLCRFTGRPTLSKRQLKLCHERDWEVVVTQEPIDLDTVFSEVDK